MAYYIVAAVYILVALLTVIFKLDIYYKITAFTGIFALFVTLYDFSLATKMRQDLNPTFVRILSWLLLIILIISPYIIINILIYSDDEDIKLLSDYGAFVSIGVVFLTKGMLLRTKEKRRRYLR